MCILQVIYSLRITTSCMAFARSPLSVQTQRENPLSPVTATTGLGFCCRVHECMRKGQGKPTLYFILIWQHLLLGLLSTLVQNPVSIQEENCYHTYKMDISRKYNLLFRKITGTQLSIGLNF